MEKSVLATKAQTSGQKVTKSQIKIKEKKRRETKIRVYQIKKLGFWSLRRMGVPAFYRWIAEKYPLAIVDVIEEEEVIIDGVKISIDTSKPNPNNIEYDNLYLDMNGIIHPCFHPEDRPSPTTFDEVFQNVFLYIDRLFNMVRPRKLLYMAIDGVAPRAKMNQQRSRRFRAAKDAADAAAEEERLRQEFEEQGRKLPPKVSSQIFDSNVITPGTEFMAVLSVALQYYVHLRLNRDLGWKSIKVILSDANVSGEGEHKIMSFMRLQRNHPHYDPNTRHCLYGLDADLIILALATHEVHFSILREVVFTTGQPDKCFFCGQVGHFAAECEGKTKSKFREFDENVDDDAFSKKPFQFVNIWTLRQYLEYDLTILKSSFEIDFERIVDDFVFMCFFVGNDFLPHLPTLEIHKGAMDLLLAVYKKGFSSIGSYLTDGSKPNLQLVEQFITAVASFEDQIFQKSERQNQWKMKYGKRQVNKADDTQPQAELDSLVPVSPFQKEPCGSSDNLEDSNSKSFVSGRGQPQPQTQGDDAQPQAEPESLVPVSQFQGSPPPSPFQKEPCGNSDNPENSDSKSVVCGRARKVARLSSTETVDAAIAKAENILEIQANRNQEELKVMLQNSLREKSDLSYSEDREEDMIKFGHPGWKRRYYEAKFSAKSLAELERIRKDVVLKYTEGLCWVMRYYYEGVCSWKWFYPYHYAPFASDFKDIALLDIEFELGSPFKPFDQLMGVLPAASAHALPEHYRKLMTDLDSPIIDFYPEDFEVDMDGKRFSWQGIPKLPFVDETRLLAEIAKVEDTLTVEEKRRNSVLSDMLFVSSSHALFPYISSLYAHKHSSKKKKGMVKKTLEREASEGMNGYICPCAGEHCPPIFRSPVVGMEDIVDNQVVCAIYELPDYQMHQSRLLPGVKLPKQLVTMGDLRESVLLHEGKGSARRQTAENVIRPMSERPKLPGITISGCQLLNAARSLVISSLQMKPSEHECVDQQHALSISFAGLGHAIPSSDKGRVAPDYSKMLPPPIVSQHNHKMPIQLKTGLCHNQPYIPPTAYQYGGPKQASKPLQNGPQYPVQYTYLVEHTYQENYGNDVNGWWGGNGTPESITAPRGCGSRVRQGVHRYNLRNLRPPPVRSWDKPVGGSQVRQSPSHDVNMLVQQCPVSSTEPCS